MAKSESTAVNALIDLVRSGKPAASEQGDDLFAAPTAPRMTDTVPPVDAAGEVAPLPRTRTPAGTSPQAVNPQVRMSTAPPTRATTIPPLPNARGGKSLPPPHRASSPGRPSPIPQPAARESAARVTAERAPSPAAAVARPSSPPAAMPAAIDRTGDEVSAESWFEASRAVEKIDETWVGTKQAPRRRAPATSLTKALLAFAALAIVGFGVAYLVFHHTDTKAAKKIPPVAHVAKPAPKAPEMTATAPAAPSTESANAATATAGATQPEPPAPTAAPSVGPADPNVPVHPNANDAKIVAKSSPDAPVAPVAVAAPVPAVAAPAPVVEEVKTAHGMVKLVDVRIDSKPEGATVMLVDNGKSAFLGTTPVAASLDPSRGYDVVLTLQGRQTTTTHFDPTKTQKLEVALARPGSSPPAVKAAASAPKAKHVASAAPKADVASAAPNADVASSAPKADPADSGANAAAGSGTLMVSSKPPCAIWVDGKDTGLITPQRAIPLPAGTHKVTLVNTDANITKTVAVMITADQSTKLIQDLMQ
jgi:hypothetical protein